MAPNEQLDAPKEQLDDPTRTIASILGELPSSRRGLPRQPSYDIMLRCGSPWYFAPGRMRPRVATPE